MPPGCYECRPFALSKDQQEDCGKCARTDSGQCREDARDQILHRNAAALLEQVARELKPDEIEKAKAQAAAFTFKTK